MKEERTKREGFSIQDSGFRIILDLDSGFYTSKNYYRNSTKMKWILNTHIKSANRFPGNSGKNYQGPSG